MLANFSSETLETITSLGWNVLSALCHKKFLQYFFRFGHSVALCWLKFGIPEHFLQKVELPTPATERPASCLVGFPATEEKKAVKLDNPYTPSQTDTFKPACNKAANADGQQEVPSYKTI
eukprot:NODE_6609_length_518_cov_9.104859_g6444_i0.p1 GENE.NODE_6609_length_518_cov_9.104859_g6444_i0~~NODE_6609_length_518_cov_9.104859_g6444_i0.p1  ORF type:complete len:120 (+),score=33.45 NODE_6609_length_518_cov_9.104859_g6444_i0:96-455(+)